MREKQMFSRRQYEIIGQLCLAGMKSPEADFVLSRELLEIGEIAGATINAADAAAREATLLADAARITAARGQGREQPQN
jgi:hypothetical protein